MRRVSVLVLSLLFALPAGAEIYQWRDAQGRTNYADIPPPAGSVKTLRGASRTIAPTGEDTAAREAGAATDAAETKSADGAADSGKAAPGKTGSDKADPAKPKTIAEKDLEFRQRRAAQAEAEAKSEKERQHAAELARSCDQARNQLKALQAGQRLARFNSQGERELLDDAGRSAETERTQKYISANCK